MLITWWDLLKTNEMVNKTINQVLVKLELSSQNFSEKQKGNISELEVQYLL